MSDRGRSVTAVVTASTLAGAALVLLGGCATTSPALVEPRAANAGDVHLTTGGAALVPIAGGTDTESLGHVVRPGLGTVVRGAVGLGGRSEATLRYGGRDVGLGVRWNAFESRTDQAGALALLVGIEARGRLGVRADDAPAHRDDAHGAGLVIPVGVAFASDAGLVTAWAVLQGGAERIAGPLQLDATQPAVELSLRRLFVVGQIGLGIGFRRVRVLAEIGVERDWVSGTASGVARSFAVTSLTPAFALSIRF